MPIVQAGSINTTALIVPDLYVQIVPPQNLVINGVPTNIIGVVGTAAWGPVGQPAIIGTMAAYAALFGAIQNRSHDMGTAIAVAVQQGAQNFRCVRVTDGTDVAASALFNGTSSGNCSFIATSLYTGSAANGDTLTLSTGSAASSYQLTVARPGLQPEVYNNITGSGATFWANLVSAVNNGNGQTRGSSQLVTLAAGAGSNASVNPSSLSLPVTITLGTGTGSVAGVDGVASITTSILLGQDTIPRKGMYALRGQGCSIGLIADLSDSTAWTTEATFGLQEGIYMITVSPSGDTIANAVTTKASAGLDSYAVKHMFGDWLWWLDTVNGVTRLVSPQGFAAGLMSNQSPNRSTLNKQLYGIAGSQKSGLAVSGQGGTYAAADLSALFGVGIDVISNPQPGGSYWGVRCGHNSSSNAAIQGDNYTRMTNYIAATLAAGMGQYVGQVVSATLLGNIRATQLSFLGAMLSQGLLAGLIPTGSGTNLASGLPYSVICDGSNNPPTRTALGYVQSDAQITYQAINEKFICNVQGGTTVMVTQGQVLPSN